MLNETGDEFRKQDAGTVLPFHAWFTAASSNASAKRTLIIGNGVPNSLDAPDSDPEKANELHIIPTADGIHIIAATSQHVIVYNASGSAVRYLQLSEGENEIEPIPQGVYFINHQKFVIR